MNGNITSWKKMVEKLAEEVELDQILQISQKIPNLGIGKRKSYWEELARRRSHDALLPLFECLVKETLQDGGYSSMIFPAIIGKESAPNFWFDGERNVPDREEAWKAIYLLLSSVSIRDTLLNLDNITDTGRRRWRRLLMTETPKEFFRRIRGEMRLKCRNVGPFYMSLLAISYWVYKVKQTSSQAGKELELEEYMEELRRDWGFKDDTVLVVFQMGRKKKEVYYFGRITPFITKWLGDYLVGKEQTPSLITFLDSLTTTSSNRVNSDLISKTREKLVFHLLKYGEVSGEILERLVELRTQDTLNSKKRFGVMNAKDFFVRLKM